MNANRFYTEHTEFTEDFQDLGFMPVTENMEVECPYCGEPQSINVELIMEHQSYTEDCQVCCKPMVLNIEVDYETEQVTVYAQQENN
jgi:transcription elongation factor Elf1